MSKLTIILLVILIINFLVESFAFICLRRRGYTIKNIALGIKYLLTHKPIVSEIYDYDDEDIDDQGYAELVEEENEIRNE